MSQEYTPVEWVDETATTQGTTINKERLDQMQSAHHYADGFEEVDTVPSADPLVDYHKVVYCTADATFYRWDGSQWTKDVDDTTKALLEAHEADHSNPHAVTKAQVGLGNVDNTSDADKPISTATQAALNLINGKIPAEASASNQLADKAFVNSSISTALVKKSITLTAAGWVNDAQTVSIAGLLADDDVLVAADPASYDDWNAAGVRAVSQAAGSITFECTATPSTDLAGNVIVGRLGS